MTLSAKDAEMFRLRRLDHEAYRAAREATILLMPLWWRWLARMTLHPDVRWFFFRGKI